VVTSKQNSRVPAYYANGNEVIKIRPGGPPETSGIVANPGTAPGWEVSGGLIMSWLQNTESGRLLMEPPKGFQVEWSFGTRTEWKGHRVRELLVLMSRGSADKQKASFFIISDGKALVGFEWTREGKTGSALYTDQIINPPLPTKLGDPPH
jgi:hypothetical protein